jgi:4'-phosphopantetheinyl transferase
MRDTTTYTNLLRAITSPVPGVDLWCAAIEPRSDDVEQMTALLAVDERERATRSIGAAGFRQYVTSRALLRVVLSWYLDIDPTMIQFQYGENGRPYLAADSPERELHFSLCHAAGVALIAVSRVRRVGIDAEHIGHNRNLDHLAGHVLSRREREKWSALPQDGRVEQFYRFWVRKEAYLKGLGTGLTVPMLRIDVSHTIPRSGEAVTLPRENGRLVEWTIYDLDSSSIADGLVAALAIESVSYSKLDHAYQQVTSGMPIDSQALQDGGGLS